MVVTRHRDYRTYADVAKPKTQQVMGHNKNYRKRRLPKNPRVSTKTVLLETLLGAWVVFSLVFQ